jgi:hypothetical protein
MFIVLLDVLCSFCSEMVTQPAARIVGAPLLDLVLGRQNQYVAKTQR